MADIAARDVRLAPTARRVSGRWLGRRKAFTAFLFALPLILVIAGLVVYPALYAIGLATLNKTMVRFVGFGNYQFLFKSWGDLTCPIPFSETLWGAQCRTFGLVVKQSIIFAVTAVIFKALIGFIVAHFVHNIPQKGQRKWRGMLLIPWVIPPAMSTLAWLWLYDPSYSAFNWILTHLGFNGIPWLGDPDWARFGVILVNVWVGAPFFMIMYLAALKSVPEQLHEAAAIDGCNWFQKIWYINLPMMRNIIQITALFSLIVTFANFDIVKILTNGGPVDQTQVFATYAFQRGIWGNDIPLGASISLFMFPILAIAAILILRNVRKRGNEA
jgi:multiple sugar transport system permease protein